MKTFKQLMDERCWSGYKPVPGKKPYSLGSCVKEEVETIEEKGPGLWANIRAKKARGERMRKPGEKGAPTEAQLKSARNEEYEADDGPLTQEQINQIKPKRESMHDSKIRMHNEFYKKELLKTVNKVKQSMKNRPSSKIKEEVEELEEVAAWQRKEGKSESGGLNRKGIESYRRENPGSKLSMAVTTKPSKLKPGSKAANRRKSFCARMGGMKRRLTSAKTARDPDSRINKALRKWNC